MKGNRVTNDWKSPTRDYNYVNARAGADGATAVSAHHRLGDVAMRASAIVLIGCAALALAGAWPAAAQPSPQSQLCTDKQPVEPDRRIAACTAAIESGRETKHDQAVAFNFRGGAYY